MLIQTKKKKEVLDITKIMENKVVLVTGAERRELVRMALTELGAEFQEKIKAAKKIFIHPNLVTHFRKSASTDVEAVRGVVDHASLLSADKILIGDAGYHDTKKAFQKFGYETLSRSGNIELIDLNDDETIESWAYTSDFKKRPIRFSKTVAQSDFNIVVVPAKMHSYTMVSLSLKTHIIGSQVVKRSPFGIWARWPWNHTGYAQFHRTLAEVYQEHPAQLAIIDGTQAMEGEGPASGNSVDLGWLLASFNPVAADALAAWLMGVNPSEVGYLYHLEKKGFGPIEPEKIEIIGSKPEPLRRELMRPQSWSKISNWR
jgi:uncharacterized protein (DUF362 family)